MKPSQVVSQSLIGLKYYPKPFPDHIWDQEFENVDIEIFSKAIKHIRSTEEQFPTYSKVRTVMNDILAKQHQNTRAGEYDRTEEDETMFEKRRGVFWKWYNWLNSFDVHTPEILVQYYDGCAKEYQALGGDREFTENVEILYHEADMQDAIMKANDKNGL